MKKLLLLFLLTGCGQSVDETKQLSDWTTKAKKPVIVKLNAMNTFTYERDYTLIDANGSIYRTGHMMINLPDTIR
jgi:Tfp pilus assembly protein PilP